MRAKPRRGYADAAFGQVHYRDLGDGTPLLLLHQAPMDSRQFDNVYEPLARRGVRAIGIDMPGFGGTDLQAGTPSVKNYALCVAPVLDALGLRSAHLLGHHTGALVATEAALLHPDRIGSLILNGPLPITEAERQEWLDVEHKRELGMGPKPGGEHLARLAERREMLANGTISADRISDYVIMAYGAAAPFWHGHHAAYTYDHAASIARIAVPTLILTNTGDVIYEHAQRARAMRPDFAYAELADGGIDIVDQQPEEWADAVSAWLVR